MFPTYEVFTSSKKKKKKNLNVGVIYVLPSSYPPIKLQRKLFTRLTFRRVFAMNHLLSTPSDSSFKEHTSHSNDHFLRLAKSGTIPSLSLSLFLSLVPHEGRFPRSVSASTNSLTIEGSPGGSEQCVA